MDRRVVITGIGVVSPIGVGKKVFGEGLREGRSGIKRISLFELPNLKSKYAAEISNLDFSYYLGKKNSKYLTRATKLLLIASGLALKDANIIITDKNKLEIGVVIGTVFGSLSSIMRFIQVNLIEGPNCVSPIDFPNILANSAASQIAIQYGIEGINTTLSTGFASSLDAIGYATHMIKNKRIRAVLSGGSEELSKEIYQNFYKLKLLSGSKKEEREFCAPFDRKRNGIILGEGSAVLILEDKDYAQSRRINAIAEVVGCGNSFGNNLDMLKKAMQLAIEDAQLKPQDIDYICANANGDIQQDRLEIEAIKDVFANHKNLCVSSIKSMTGECYAASGAIQCIATCLAILHSIMPPTVNFQKSELDLGPLNIQNKKIKKRIKIAMINSFGCDGNNSSLIIRSCR